MGAIVLVSGCPGSGKTTLARALAASVPQGIHLLSDVFYGFPAALVDPTLPESHGQNTVIQRAIARSTRAFAEGGYPVFLDGVIGPWFLPVHREELAGVAEVSYVVLRAGEETALRRVRAREGPGASARVRHMVAAFADLGALGRHAVETEGRSAQAVLDDVRAGVSEGRFRLDWACVPDPGAGVR